MTASGVAAAKNVIDAFLDSHFPSFPKPAISENTAAPMDARYFTTSGGILVPVYSDAWNEGRPDILIHECGHWVAYHTDDPYPRWLIAMGGNPALYSDPQIGEMFAEHFVRAYVETYDGRNYPQLVGRVPFDAAKMRAFAEALTPAAAGAPKVIAAVPPPGGAPRKMYDSTAAADIPPSAEMVAGYVDGRFRWLADDWARFPDAVKVRIACFASTDDGHVLDVEQGDATPDEAPAWAKARRAAGVTPACYVNKSNWAAVRAAFDAAGEPQPLYWLASYDNDPTIPDGCVAKQYANEPLTGGHYDISSVAPYWPSVDGGAEPMDDSDIYAAVVRVIKTRLAASNQADEAFDLSDTVIAVKTRLNEHIHKTGAAE